MNQIRILVVEDDIFTSQDICEALSDMDYSIIGQAYDSEEARSLLHKHTPDMVLLDINLGESDSGITLANHIQETYNLPVIFLTAYSDPGTLEKAKKTRPQGYIVKPFKIGDLFAAIEIAFYNHSQRWQPASWLPSYINRCLRTDLTPKEVEILRDMFEGKTNKQLSQKHFISPNTIKTHVRRIYDKLNVHSRTEALALIRRRLSI